ncbi:MAG: hypothetical protein R2824_01255 [Saprospiraceae bacterium]|nr:hypothetical protein [Lewinella sp.]
MKYLTIFTLLLAILTGCNSGQAAGNTFEGHIQYTIEYQPQQTFLDRHYFEEKRGTAIHYYYKQGDYLRVYLTPDGDTCRFELYKIKENRIYFSTDLSTDTVYTYSCAEGYGDLLSFRKTESKPMLNQETVSYECTMRYDQASAPGPPFQVAVKMFYGPSIKIDGSIYADYKEGFYNKFAEASNSLPLRTEVKGDPLADQIIQATDVKQQSLDDKLFNKSSNWKIVER